MEVKSHRGTVFVAGDRLKRQMGRQTHAFEKDFLAQATRQAIQVKQKKGFSFVTPIVAFSQAQVSVASGKVRGVRVVETAKLIGLLRSLG